MSRVRPALLALIGFSTLLAAWSLLIVLSVVPRESLPYPTDVFGRLPELLTDGAFARSLGDTLSGWLVSLVLSSVAAVVLGLVISTTAWLTKPAMLVVNLFRSIPSTALIPLGILLFGLGMEMKVSIAIYAAFWIVLINTMYGVQSTEPMRKDAARSMQWGWFRTHTYVTVPSALPSIVTGIRIASGVALVVVLSTELLGARSGVGTLMITYQQALQIDAVYATIAVIGVIGVLLYSALVFIERKSLKWVHHV